MIHILIIHNFTGSEDKAANIFFSEYFFQIQISLMVFIIKTFDKLWGIIANWCVRYHALFDQKHIFPCLRFNEGR